MQTQQLKTENDELKDEMDKRAVEVQHLKEKVCGYVWCTRACGIGSSRCHSDLKMHT